MQKRETGNIIEWQSLAEDSSLKGMLSFLQPAPSETPASETPASETLAGETKGDRFPASDTEASKTLGRDVITPEQSGSCRSDAILVAPLGTHGDDPSRATETRPHELLGSNSRSGQSAAETARDLEARAEETLHRLAITPPLVIPGLGRVRLHKITLVQDALSTGEDRTQSEFAKLARGRDPKCHERSVRVTVTLNELADRVRRHSTTVRRNVRALHEKGVVLLVEKENRYEMTGRTYLVLPYRKILESWKADGYGWVAKSCGHKLVKSTVAVRAYVQALARESRDGDSPLSQSGDAGVRGGETRASELRCSEVPPRHSQEDHECGDTENEVPGVQEVEVQQLTRVVFEYLREHDDYVRQLIRACRRASPDVEIEEIIEIVEEVAERAIGRANSPAAVVLSQAPKMCAGYSLSERRRRKAAERERQLQAELERGREEAELKKWFARKKVECQELLDNPDAPEEKKEYARNFLARYRSDFGKPDVLAHEEVV